MESEYALKSGLDFNTGIHVLFTELISKRGFYWVSEHGFVLSP